MSLRFGATDVVRTIVRPVDCAVAHPAGQRVESSKAAITRSRTAPIMWSASRWLEPLSGGSKLSRQSRERVDSESSRVSPLSALGSSCGPAPPGPQGSFVAGGSGGHTSTLVPTGSRLFSSHNPGDPKRRAVPHGDGVRLLRFPPLNRLPLEEAIDRHDASTLAVGVPERRQPRFWL